MPCQAACWWALKTGIEMRGAWIGAVVLMLCAGCAQVGSPEGGGFDESAPEVLVAEPAFGTTGFTGTEFTLVFDEFVKLKDARRQMLVSPPLPAPQRAAVRGRSVTVELGDSLMPDRTYIVQFGDAVRDLREANVAVGLQYVFSTGTALDAGRVMGSVRDAWTGEVLPGARVMLYSGGIPEDILDPSLPDSVRPLPDYVGMLDDSGAFDVGYLPLDSFGCVVVDDANGNYRSDNAEAVAWASTVLVSAMDSAGWVPMQNGETLRMDAPPVVPLTYTSGVRLDSSGYFRAAITGLGDLKKGPDGWLDAEFNLTLADSSGETGRVHSVPLPLEGDSVWAVLDLGDTSENAVWLLRHPAGTDTLKFKDLEPVDPPFAVGPVERTLHPGGAFSMRFAPVPTALDTSLCSAVVILEGDTTAVSGGAFRLEGPHLKAGPFAPGSKVDIVLEPGAVAGQGGGTPDTLDWRVSVKKEADFGTIRLNRDTVSLAQADALWLLVNGSGLPMMDHPLDSEGRFTGLLPGKYGVVCVSDSDGNGRWSGVRPAQGMGPEAVVRWASGVDVRAGWEIELDIAVHPRP